MRKLIFLGLSLAPLFAFAKFVSPLAFDGSYAQKEEVIQFIKSNVHKIYCEDAPDACGDSTLRVMEKYELVSFKQATEATDKKIMQQVIDTYCKGKSEMCSYSTVVMMYRQNLKASPQKLE